MLLKENLATSKLTASKLTGDNDEATTKPETVPKPLEGEIGTESYADEYDDEEDHDDAKVRLPLHYPSVTYFQLVIVTCMHGAQGGLSDFKIEWGQ
jgi:hypothetical protein